MKTLPKIHSLAALIAVASLTPLALAQVAGAPPAPNVNASAQSSGNALNGVNSGANPVSATNTVNTNANAAGQPTVNPTLNSTSGTAGTTGAVSGSNSSVTGTNTTTVNADGTLNSTATASTNTPTTGLRTAGSGSMVLESQATSQQIRSLPYDSRTDATLNVESRLDASARFTDNARTHARDLRGESQAQLQSAINVARDREARVRSSLRAVRMAGKDNYEAARNQLAQDYDAYASAVAQVEASSSVNATMPR